MGKFCKLYLEEYFNHKVIGAEEDIKDASTLSDNEKNGYFFYPDMLPDSLEEFVIDNVPFTFPDKSPQKYDNIICEEQTIVVPPNKYKMLCILGFCELGDFSEKVILQYDDGTHEEIEVYFLDWWRGFSWQYDINTGCKVALKANIYAKVIPHYIYYNKRIITNSNKVLRSIELPYSPNMHILGITLEYSNE